MPKLQSILEEISAMLEVPDDELTDEQKQAMDAYLDLLGEQEADKVDAIGQFFRLESGRADLLNAEAVRLAKRARTAKKRIAWLKEMYLHHMRQAGVKRLNGNIYTMSIRGMDVVHITDENVLPEQYVRTTSFAEPDKVAIKDALKNGQEVPGAELTKNYSLQVS